MRHSLPLILVFGLMLGANASSWVLFSDASAYNNVQVTDEGSYMSLSEWAAAGFQDNTSAEVLGHPFAPPGGGSFASTSYDQSAPANSVLRGLAITRMGYRVGDQDPYEAHSRFTASYDLQVENLSNDSLDIYLGNNIHGVIAAVDDGAVLVQQMVHIQDMGEFRSEIRADADSHEETGQWIGAVHSTNIVDPVFGSRSALELNSSEFYGNQIFAPHSTATFSIEHQLWLSSHIVDTSPTYGSGLAHADFTNTGNMTVKAYDPVTHADRSNEIRVTVVPEPMSMIGLSLGIVASLKRRRPQKPLY